MSFADHQIFAGKTVEVPVKTFFLWRSPELGRKNCSYFGEDFFFFRTPEFGRKNCSNFGEDLIFLEMTSIFGPNSTTKLKTGCEDLYNLGIIYIYALDACST